MKKLKPRRLSVPAISTSNKDHSGFTLVEVLVVAPLVILIIGVLIAAIVTLTGSGLTARAENELAQLTQVTLSDIEHDLSLSGDILDKTGNLSSPQGVNNGTGGFNLNDNVLISQTPALTQDTLSDDRKLIFYKDSPHGCSSQDVTDNEVVYVTNIYFVQDNTLWRRTLLPSNVSNACSTPWQKNTCQPGQTASICGSKDSRLLDLGEGGQASFSYYTIDGTQASTSAPENIRTIEISLTATRSVAGKPISYDSSLKIPID